MKSIAAITLAMGLLLGGCVSQPMRTAPQTLSAKQVEHLFAGKTVESVNRSTGITSFTYYGPDGRVLQSRLWSQRSGKWKVKNNGKVCLTFEKTQCRRVVNDNGVYYKLRKQKGEKAERVVRYRSFRDGNLLLGKHQAWPKVTVFRP